MFENENSIYKNMVNTNPFENRRTDYEQADFNINITQTPQSNQKYKMDKDFSRKLKKGIIIGGIVLAALQGTSYIVSQIGSEVIYSEDYPMGIELNVTRSGNGYFELEDGTKVGNYNGISALDATESLINSGKIEKGFGGYELADEYKEMSGKTM